MVPKVVMAMLVHKSRDDIASELVHRLYGLITGPSVLLRGACRRYWCLLHCC